MYWYKICIYNKYFKDILSLIWSQVWQDYDFLRMMNDGSFKIQNHANFKKGQILDFQENQGLIIHVYDVSNWYHL